MLKKTLYILLSVVVLVSVISLTQWERWFSNPAEAPYVTPPYQDRITLSYGANGTAMRTISWRCDTVVTQAQVYLVQSEKGDTVIIPAVGQLVHSRSGKSAFYKATIDSLTADMHYSYQLINGQQKSAWLHFNNLPADSISFIVFGDIHIVSAETEAMFELVANKYPQVHFWGFLGDIIERPTDAYWNDLYGVLGKYTTHQNTIVCTGNHEYLKGIKKELDPRWIHTFSNPVNGNKKQVGRNFYIDFPHMRYVVLDTDGLQMPWDYMATRAWLKKVLNNNAKKWIVVSMHHPIYSASKGRDNWLIRNLLNPLFKKYKVDLILQGHDHVYARTATWAKDMPVSPMYVVMNSSNKNYKLKEDTKAIKVGYNKRFYQHVSVTEEYMSVQTYEAENNTVIDSFAIRK